MDDDGALKALAEHFARATVFNDAPLYRMLVRATAARPDALKLVASTHRDSNPACLITMEPTQAGAPGLLRARDPDGAVHDVAELDGHVTWVRQTPLLSKFLH